jgi:hypothetical protein
VELCDFGGWIATAVDVRRSVTIRIGHRRKQKGLKAHRLMLGVAWAGAQRMQDAECMPL